MQIELLVDAEEFWARLAADMAAAQARIYIQTLSFEGDTAGQTLATALNQAAAPDKRVIVDAYTRHVLSDKFLYSPRNLFDTALQRERRETSAMIADLMARGTGVRFVNPVGPLFCRFAARNHKKIIVIDDRISYIGGINFSDHNFHWHDMMLRLEDEAAATFLTGDFLTSWEGRHFGGSLDLDGVRLLSMDGSSNEAGFEPVLELIDGATTSVYVQSPYLSFPFCDRLRQARRRGVAVTVVTPAENNKKVLQDYIHWEAARSDFDLWLYPGRMTHLKAMLIDGRYLIAGSSNFDYFSYRFEQETVAIVTAPVLVAEFIARVVDRDQTLCYRADRSAAPRSGYMRQWQIKSLGRVSEWFCSVENGRK